MLWWEDTYDVFKINIDDSYSCSNHIYRIKNRGDDSMMKLEHIGVIMFFIGILMLFGIVGHIEVNNAVDWAGVIQHLLISIVLLYTGSKVINGE